MCVKGYRGRTAPMDSWPPLSCYRESLQPPLDRVLTAIGSETTMSSNTTKILVIVGLGLTVIHYAPVLIATAVVITCCGGWKACTKGDY